MDRLEGIYSALWTPTNSSGEILWQELEELLGFVLKGGVQGIMALGSTGEFVHLTFQQRTELLERVIRTCKEKGNARVIANVSDVQHRNVVALARYAKQAGADCAAVLPPWYFPVEQRDLAEFFIQVGRQVDLPLALYNYPEVAGNSISIETIRTVAKAVKVVAVKQSGGDFEYHYDLLRVGREMGFEVLTGSDTRLEETLKMGCAGAISGLANAVPEVFRKIYQNFQLGKS
ncbi:MAG TPA: dihydrodipicolinate synthase family protein, partial [Verrucomicrobiae bacterium]|nr:dihydrodipicolinate synthase family protein [Verrucomicrobiae bacterium]